MAAALCHETRQFIHRLTRVTGFLQSDYSGRSVYLLLFGRVIVSAAIKRLDGLKLKEWLNNSSQELMFRAVWQRRDSATRLRNAPGRSRFRRESEPIAGRRMFPIDRAAIWMQLDADCNCGRCITHSPRTWKQTKRTKQAKVIGVTSGRNAPLVCLEGQALVVISWSCSSC